MRTVFAFTKNGAVIKCWDRVDDALAQATAWAPYNISSRYQGFDDNNKSAVVTRPDVLQVERLVDDRPSGSREMVSWRLAAVEAKWIGGIKQEAA